MFDDMEDMLNFIRKKVYGDRMDAFRRKNAQLLAEMVGFVEQAETQNEVAVQKEAEVQNKTEVQEEAEVQTEPEGRKKAAAQVAKAFADAVEARFAKRGKISSRRQMDINLFMIYYVFPAVLLTESACAVSVADALRDEWRGRFRDSAQLDYTTFEELNGSFRTKILGMF